MILAETHARLALDALRYFTIGEGCALMIVSGVSVLDAFVYAWPRVLRFGIVLRWFGRFGIVAFITYFVHQRLGKPLNMWTPFAFTSFTFLLVGTWLTRAYEFNWKDHEMKFTKEPL